MKNQGYPETTLKPALRRLNMLSREANLDNPEEVKAVIANRRTTNGYKQSLTEIYNHYVKANGLTWEKPFFRQEKRLPRVPSTEAINKIIAGATPKYATIFSILRDTGMMPAELSSVRLRDIDLEKGVINAPGKKRHLPRVLALKPPTLAMLKTYLLGNTEDIAFPNSLAIHKAWKWHRHWTAEKLKDPNLLKIRLYDLRHYFGTMTYYKTKDILYTKQQMGHKKIETTLIYTQLVNFGDEEWTAKVAKTLQEACQLIEGGFEYVTEMDGVKIFRKRK